MPCTTLVPHAPEHPIDDIEPQSLEARATHDTSGTAADAVAPPVERVPSYTSDPGDHEALLNSFLTKNGDWEKYRTWEDNTTIANHESLTLRALFDHDAQSRDPKWTIAAYETPVSGLLWQMTVAATTPAPVLNTLLTVLAAGGAWDTAVGSPVTPRMIAQVSGPLIDAGWQQTAPGRYLHWQTPSGDAGIAFDTFAAPGSDVFLPAWTLWAGPTINRPVWAINATADTPAGLLADLSEELAHGMGTRRSVSSTAAPTANNAAALPPNPPQRDPAAHHR